MGLLRDTFIEQADFAFDGYTIHSRFVCISMNACFFGLKNPAYDGINMQL